MDRTTLPDDAPCPCGSGRHYGRCCGPLHQGADAATAEALMRSRYCAYALGLADYLAHSWHPDTRPNTPIEGNVKWAGLAIVSTDRGGPDTTEGEVAFCARYLDGERLESLCERSRFIRYEGRWVYLDGLPGDTDPAAGRRIGRNEPCPCGSGAKFKRCCGK
jgi:SEC-C motif-containing protein